MNPTTVGDMTKEELEALIAEEVRRQIQQIAPPNRLNETSAPRPPLRSPLDVPMLDVGEWTEGLLLLRSHLNIQNVVW
jgi:hypothetical protein